MIKYFHKYILDTIKVLCLKKIIKNKFVFYYTDNLDDIQEIYKLRYKIYCLEKKYLDPALSLKGLEVDKYDIHSIHFIVKNKKQSNIVATVRLIKNEINGLPIENDFRIKLDSYKKKSQEILEISRLAVSKNYRKASMGKHYVLLILIKLIFDYCIKYNYNFLVAAVDMHFFNILKKMNLDFKILDKPKMYMGSESIPILINVSEALPKLKRKNFIVWRFLKY